AQMDFFSKAEAELRRLPGVDVVGVSDSVPPGGVHQEQIYSIIAVAGSPAATGGTGGMVVWRWVTPDYFSALDIPIVRGRGFTQDQQTSIEQSLIGARRPLWSDRVHGHSTNAGDRRAHGAWSQSCRHSAAHP